ncbi:bifunctional precorrin-2 dehydrogenase/sirohydrochlorin ferrochelatase [Rummeliibacillus sp. SL167]|uniref:precorrin-2 dehydrogenase/sirohydrochlorin ferrochelatase family protein n=1 Tax=Rummeliibacillus sp. SL167 TaxID=2579792 RepID=UPI0011B72D73|nr:NAD(P)-dependent oxidoreductase [Rummeliibacillus sp. SL167]
MGNYYPIMLNITDRPVVVVGGGSVATRKVTSLLKAQPQITIVSPELSPKLQRLVEEQSIEWRKKTFAPDDLDRAFLIIAATNCSEINEFVAQSVHPYQLCNVVDREDLSQFIVPSVVRRGPLAIAVSTSGANPKLAQKIKKELETQYDETYEDYVLFLQQARRQIIDEITDAELKSVLLSALLDSKFLTLTKAKQIQERDQLLKKLLKKGTIQ